MTDNRGRMAKRYPLVIFIHGFAPGHSKELWERPPEELPPARNTREQDLADREYLSRIIEDARRAFQARGGQTMQRGDKLKVKVARWPFKVGDVGEFRFEVAGRLWIGGLFLGEIDFSPDEVEPAGPEAKLGTQLSDDGRRFVILTSVSFIKSGRERHVLHAERLQQPLEPLAEYPTAARRRREVIECRTADGAKEVLELAKRIAWQHPALTVIEWRATTERALEP